MTPLQPRAIVSCQDFPETAIVHGTRLVESLCDCVSFSAVGCIARSCNDSSRVIKVSCKDGGSARAENATATIQTRISDYDGFAVAEEAAAGAAAAVAATVTLS